MNYLAVIFHELREVYRGFRYPGYIPLHHPVVQRMIDEYASKVMDKKYPVGSEWKRVEPGKQIVQIDRTYRSNTEEKGWMVDYHPTRGGRAMTRDVAWFTENFERYCKVEPNQPEQFDGGLSYGGAN